MRKRVILGLVVVLLLVLTFGGGLLVGYSLKDKKGTNSNSNENKESEEYLATRVQSAVYTTDGDELKYQCIETNENEKYFYECKLKNDGEPIVYNKIEEELHTEGRRLKKEELRDYMKNKSLTNFRLGSAEDYVIGIYGSKEGIIYFYNPKTKLVFDKIEYVKKASFSKTEACFENGTPNEKCEYDILEGAQISPDKIEYVSTNLDVNPTVIYHRELTYENGELKKELLRSYNIVKGYAVVEK